MSVRAVWKRGLGDPRSTLGYVSMDGERLLGRPRETLGCLGKVGALVLLFIHPWAALALFAAAVLLPRLKREPRAVGPLLTLPFVVPTYPCEVEIRRQGTTLGLDRGAVSFVDGWLVFEGFRTDFSLSPSDVRLPDEEQRLILEEGGDVLFRPDDALGGPGIERARLRNAFAHELDAWVRSDPVARGRSVLPPFTLHPSGVVRVWLDLLSATFSLAVVIGLALAFLRYSFGCFLFGFGFLGGIRDGLTKLGRVRRFAREARATLPVPGVAS